MGITGVNSVRQLTMKFNCPYRAASAGWSEVRYMPQSVSEDQALVDALLLCNLRRRFLNVDCTIVDAKIVNWDNPGRTRDVLDAPLDGAWPDADRDEFVIANVTVAVASPAPSAGVANDAIVALAAGLLKVSNYETTALFRVEGSGAVRSEFHFHSVPELFVDGLEAENMGTPPAWVDPSATPTLPTALEASTNFFTNYKDYFTAMKKLCVLVSDWTEASGTTPASAYNIHTIDRVKFLRMSDRQLGKPFGLPVGRVLAR